MEAKFSDIEFARRTYELVVRRVIDSGVRFKQFWSRLCSVEHISDRQRHAAIMAPSI
jgi:hypothetical protein